MARAGRWSVLLLLILLAAVGLSNAQNAKYAIKTGATPPPKEISESIRKLLDNRSVQFLVPGGKVGAELWFRKTVPADATPEQIKNGITYRELKQTEILGVVRFDQDWLDYRKQKVKAGVYTLRLGFQPEDGDHTGSSQFKEFVAVLLAAKDTKAQVLDYKEMVEISQKSISTGHPGVFMLFPNAKPGAAPQLAAKEMNHWVLNTKQEITVAGKKTGASLGIGLTLIGSAP